jgi:hypothetical protein
MKKIIIPLVKVIILLVALIAILLICLWDGSLYELRKLRRKPFLDGEHIYGSKYTFPTLKDWLLDRKHYINNGD